MNWDTLPEPMVKKLLAMSGACTLQFTDADGVQHTETVIRNSAVVTATRFTFNDGTAVWSNVSVEVRFINVHND